MTKIISSTFAPLTTSEDNVPDSNGTHPTEKTNEPTFNGARDFADRVYGTTSEVGWAERLRWRFIHWFGIHTAIDAVNVQLDQYGMVKQFEERRECAVCEVVM